MSKNESSVPYTPHNISSATPHHLNKTINAHENNVNNGSNNDLALEWAKFHEMKSHFLHEKREFALEQREAQIRYDANINKLDKREVDIQKREIDLITRENEFETTKTKFYQEKNEFETSKQQSKDNQVMYDHIITMFSTLGIGSETNDTLHGVNNNNNNKDNNNNNNNDDNNNNNNLPYPIPLLPNTISSTTPLPYPLSDPTTMTTRGNNIVVPNNINNNTTTTTTPTTNNDVPIISTQDTKALEYIEMALLQHIDHHKTIIAADFRKLRQYTKRLKQFETDLMQWSESLQSNEDDLVKREGKLYQDTEKFEEFSTRIEKRYENVATSHHDLDKKLQNLRMLEDSLDDLRLYANYFERDEALKALMKTNPIAFGTSFVPPVIDNKKNQLSFGTPTTLGTTPSSPQTAQTFSKNLLTKLFMSYLKNLIQQSSIYATMTNIYYYSSISNTLTHVVTIENLKKTVLINHNPSKSLLDVLWADSTTSLFNILGKQRNNANVIPELSDKVQIFVSSLSVANGEWIQIYGLGSILQSTLISIPTRIPTRVSSSCICASSSSMSFNGRLTNNGRCKLGERCPAYIQFNTLQPTSFQSALNHNQNNNNNDNNNQNNNNNKNTPFTSNSDHKNINITKNGIFNKSINTGTLNPFGLPMNGISTSTGPLYTFGSFSGNSSFGTQVPTQNGATRAAQVAGYQFVASKLTNNTGIAHIDSTNPSMFTTPPKKKDGGKSIDDDNSRSSNDDDDDDDDETDDDNEDNCEDDDGDDENNTDHDMRTAFFNARKKTNNEKKAGTKVAKKCQYILDSVDSCSGKNFILAHRPKNSRVETNELFPHYKIKWVFLDNLQ